MQLAVSPPAARRGGEQWFVAVALVAQHQLFRRKLLEHRLDGGTAGREQRHLMGLDVAERTTDGLFGG